MEIILKRVAFNPSYTIGHLSIVGNTFTCDTLEDTNRDLNKDGKFDNGEVKIHGSTCIPFGRYKVNMDTVSPRFSMREQYTFCKGIVPRLENVPSFDGVLIHIGNKPEDTEGCILVGENKIKGQVINSTETFKKLYSILNVVNKRKEDIYITIQ